jgi:hypothetical protein
MFKTQIRLTGAQSEALKRLAVVESKSVAELIRISVDQMLATKPVVDHEEMKRRALSVADICSGPVDLAENHDLYLIEAYEA